MSIERGGQEALARLHSTAALLAAIIACSLPPLHVTAEYHGPPPAAAEVIDGLTPYRQSHVADQPTAAFFRRLDPPLDLWKRSGYWAHAHPWMEAILPWSAVRPYLSQVLADLAPPPLGGGHILLWPCCRGRISRAPLFRTPDSELVMGVGILPVVSRDLVSQATTRLRMASDLAATMGGKRYLSGHLNFDRARWQAHFGEKWPWLVEMKRRFDPHRILNPELIPFD